MTQDIVERLPKHVELLANTTMDITLADWGPIVNDILKAADLIESLRTENEKQARINGMSAERELALRNENASLRARVDKLVGAIEPFALHINPSILGNKLIDTVAYTADQHRAALAAQQKEVGRPIHADDCEAIQRPRADCTCVPTYPHTQQKEVE